MPRGLVEMSAIFDKSFSFHNLFLALSRENHTSIPKARKSHQTQREGT